MRAERSDWRLDLWRRLKRALRDAGPDGLDVFSYCRSGKHRGFGVGRLIERALQAAGHRAEVKEDLCRWYVDRTFFFGLGPALPPPSARARVGRSPDLAPALGAPNAGVPGSRAARDSPAPSRAGSPPGPAPPPARPSSWPAPSGRLPPPPTLSPADRGGAANIRKAVVSLCRVLA